MRPQRGFSLAELLVALALGLMVAGACGALFVGSKRTHRLHDASARLHENGRLALDLLGRHLRHAGFVERTPRPATLVGFRQRFGIPPLLGCSAGAPDGVFAIAPDACEVDPIDNDALLVRYQVAPDPADGAAVLPPYDATSGAGADCLGQSVADAGNLFATSLFRIRAGSLACMGNGNPGRWQPLFAGAEQLRLQFGFDADGDGSVDAYVPAADSRLGNVAAWDRIHAVDVCLLFRSDDAVLGDEAQSVVDCDGAARVSADGRLRRVFRTTFFLPNTRDSTSMVRDTPLP